MNAESGCAIAAPNVTVVVKNPNLNEEPSVAIVNEEPNGNPRPIKETRRTAVKKSAQAQITASITNKTQ